MSAETTSTLLPDGGHLPCRACGGEVCRQKGESTADHERRRTCGLRCATTVQASKNAEWGAIWADLEALHPGCTICGRRFGHFEGEARTKYAARCTCLAPACVKAVKKRAGARSGEHNTAAICPAGEFRALLEIDFGGGFGRNQVRDRETNVFLTAPRPEPIDATRAGVSVGWAV